MKTPFLAAATLICASLLGCAGPLDAAYDDAPDAASADAARTDDAGDSAPDAIALEAAVTSTRGVAAPSATLAVNALQLAPATAPRAALPPAAPPRASDNAPAAPANALAPAPASIPATSATPAATTPDEAATSATAPTPAATAVSPLGVNPAPAVATAPLVARAPSLESTGGEVASDLFARIVTDPDLRVVLRVDPDAAEVTRWLAGGARLVSRDAPYLVRRAVRTRALPRELARWEGRRVELLDASGVVCEATLTGLALEARVEPDYEETSRWAGSVEDHVRPASRAVITREVWDASESSGRALTIGVRPSRGTCRGATWARVAGGPPVHLGAVDDAAADVRTQALDLTRVLPAYADVQRDYETQMNEERAAEAQSGATPAERPARWEDADGTTISVRAAQRPDRDAQLVWVSVSTYQGCGGFSGSVSVTYEVTHRDGRLVFTRVADDAGVPDASPEFVGDLDGDGALEFVSPYHEPVRVYHGCDC